jgi:long-chain fatty acid transport protein
MGSTSPDANAAGFASARFGGEQGSVVATNPTALYFNPAGIGFSEGIHLYLDGEIAMRDATWTHTAPQPGAGDQPNSQYGNSGKAALFNVFAGPALGATISLGHLVIGAGLFVPFGGRVNFGSNSSIPTSSPLAATAGSGAALCSSNGVCPLAANGVQRWHLSTASLTFIHAAAGGAYRLGPISIGATGNFINSQVMESQSRTLGGQVDSTVENTAALNVTGNNLSFAAGVMIEVVPEHLWLAGSYQSQPGMGPQTLKGTLDYTNGPSPYYPSTGVVKYNVDFHQALPDIYRAGIRLRVSDAVELRAFGDITRWSVMTSQCINLSADGPACQVYGASNNPAYPYGGDATPKESVIANIPRNWKNTWGARFGGSYWVRPEIEIFAGVGYETGATPDSTIDPGAMDANNFAGALGGRFELGDRFYIAGSYTHIQYQNRNVTTSQLAVYNGVPVAVPTLQQDGNGLYTQWIGIFDINAEKQF